MTIYFVIPADPMTTHGLVTVDGRIIAKVDATEYNVTFDAIFKEYVVTARYEDSITIYYADKVSYQDAPVRADKPFNVTAKV